jgi:hypothetical protein
MTPGCLDAIYVAASAKDDRFTRICVASIRWFYPDAPIRILAGGPLQPDLRRELQHHWNAAPVDLPAGDWGWGFIKLEPLFGPAGERFLVLDSDTTFVGPVLATWAEAWQQCGADFLVDEEPQTPADTRRLYYDWRQLQTIDPAARPPQFLFNSGQWFGTAGLLQRRDFLPFIDWDMMPPRLRHSTALMPGDQGILNYVMNQKSYDGQVSVCRRPILRWPGHGLAGVSAAAIAAGRSPALIVHWAGFKAARLGALPGADILRFFEARYYERLPAGRCRQQWAALRHPLRHWSAGWRQRLQHG